MKYKYIVLLIIIVVISAYLLLITPKKLIDNSTKNSPPNVEKHFNAKDLAKLGCNVVNAEEKMTNLNVPLIGEIEVYGLKDTGSCEVDLISTLSKINDNDAGTWAGIRASSNIKAEKNSYKVSMYEGTVGNYSEIHIFEKGTQQVGFRYIVELNGILHKITIFSSKIVPDEKFEIILREKIK